MTKPARRAEIKRITEEGKQAALEGKGRHTCPYRAHDAMHWGYGWDLGERLRQEEAIAFASEMGYPPYTPRRPASACDLDGYLESDMDYVLNNLDLAVRLLDKYGPTSDPNL